MSRRKCCCPCETNCVPIRDDGKVTEDDLILEIPEGLEDKDYCNIPPPNGTCETQITGDHVLPFDGYLAQGQSWDKLGTIEPNCHCIGGAFIEGLFNITEQCVDISEGYDPEKLVCIVTVTIVVLETDCGYFVPDGASQKWIYKVAGPIDVKNGNKFEVPFFSEEVGLEHHGPESVCNEMTYPDSVFIKESP